MNYSYLRSERCNFMSRYYSTYPTPSEHLVNTRRMRENHAFRRAGQVPVLIIASCDVPDAAIRCNLFRVEDALPPLPRVGPPPRRGTAVQPWAE